LPSAGYRHMLEQLGVRKEKLAELVEAATTVGYPGGEQRGGVRGAQTSHCCPGNERCGVKCALSVCCNFLVPRFL
jgi:hypothetical protein